MARIVVPKAEVVVVTLGQAQVECKEAEAERQNVRSPNQARDILDMDRHHREETKGDASATRCEATAGEALPQGEQAQVPQQVDDVRDDEYVREQVSLPNIRQTFFQLQQA